MYRPDLFKLNKITHEKRLHNLIILLSSTTPEQIGLPTNEDVNSILKTNKDL